MNFKKGLKGALLIAGTLVGTYVGCGTCNHAVLTYKNNYETKNEKVMSKLNGFLSSTQATLDKVTGRIDIDKRTGFFESDGYYGNCDGSVDWFRDMRLNFFTRGPSLESFYRDRDYQDYPDKFKEADKYFKEQLERFGLCKDK